MSPVFLFNAQFFAAFASYTSLLEFNKKSPPFFFLSPFFSNQPTSDLSVSKKTSVGPLHERDSSSSFFVVINYTLED